MPSTIAADWVFEPKVWQDHIEAYFDRKLVYGAFASTDNTLTTEPGLTVNFPYFNAIGDAEEPAEDTGLAVDNMSDNSFSATVKEVAKAVGIKKKAFKKSATNAENIVKEAQRQIARVMAEKVDKDLLVEFSAGGNFFAGYTATGSGDTMSAGRLLSGKLIGLGDRAGEAQVVFMHSRQFLDLMRDSTAGFLKADANDPMYLVQGFMGRLLGMAIVVVDTVPANAQIGGVDAYQAFIHTVNPYAYITKQNMELEDDYDILHREFVVAADQWYAVKSYHAKVNAENKRTIRVITTIAA